MVILKTIALYDKKGNKIVVNDSEYQADKKGFAERGFTAKAPKEASKPEPPKPETPEAEPPTETVDKDGSKSVSVPVGKQ